MSMFPKWRFVGRFVKPPYTGFYRRKGVEVNFYNYIQICYKVKRQQ